MKTQRLFKTWAIMMMGLIFINCQKKENPVPFRSSLQEAAISPDSLINGQRDGLIIGNGDLYGLIWEKDSSLFMRITKNDIWDARVDVSEDGELPRIDVVNNVATGSKGSPPSYSKTFPQPRAAAALRFEAGSADAVKASLDIEKAFIGIISGKHKKTTLRVLHNRNVLLINSPYAVTLEEIKAETLPGATLGNTGGVSWLLMKMPGDLDYKGMDYAVAVATKGNLKAVSLVTSFDNQSGGILDQAIALSKSTLEESENDLIAEHEKAWESYWSKSGIQLEDKVIERWWYRMLYFAQTVSKAGAAPVALMPPLATDFTPWHADFHYNYNSWQAFWPLPAANQADLADPWIDYVYDMLPRLKFLAKATYDCEGMCCPISSFLHEPDPAVCQSNNKRQISFNPYGLTIGITGMTVQNAWQKHLCDPDSVYLRAKIYPIIRESALFYLSFMEKCKKDATGKILLGPSYSPEHGKFGIFNCPFDIGYVHYTFDALIEAANELKTDAGLIGKCREYKALLGNYPTTLTDAGEPILVDWEGCGYKEVRIHNITVPASPVFPCDQVTWFSPEPEKELFRRTIRETRFNGNNSHVIFNIAKARLSMPEAIDSAKNWFISRELPNGLFVWKGHAHGTYMPEMIGVAGLINEFLLQSVQNKIRLFPCWPADQDARFTRLRAQGGFIVSSEFKDGRVTSATIESVAAKKLQLLCPWKTMYANGNQVPVGIDGLAVLNTKPGEVLHITETQKN